MLNLVTRVESLAKRNPHKRGLKGMMAASTFITLLKNNSQKEILIKED